jgi:hypothetical protein
MTGRGEERRSRAVGTMMKEDTLLKKKKKTNLDF